MPHLKIFMENFLPNKVVVHLYLFRASMEHRIRGEGDGWNILTPNGWHMKQRNL